MTLLTEIHNLEVKQAIEGYNKRDDLAISGKRGETFEDMPNLEFFENLPVTHNPDVFFQTLANCIRNNVLAHQSTIYILRKVNKNCLKT